MLEKLHLGCGQTYLDGYVNIDFPPSEHTVMVAGVADKYADILGLSYPASSIAEVRLHHVFEHFPRPTACALIASWRSWLIPKGILRIEVPDFERTAKALLSTFSSAHKKNIARRHIFGSHEAAWAVHYDGYTPLSLSALINSFGFRIIKIERSHWRGTYNFAVTAEAKKTEFDRNKCRAIAEAYLSQFIVDQSESEKRLFQVWLDLYASQIDRSWPKSG